MDSYTNFTKVTVDTTGYNASATTVTLASGQGARWTQSVPFNAVWWNSTDYSDPNDDPNREIVRVTAISTDTLTVTRGQESITATTKNTAGKTYKMHAGLTAKFVTDIPLLKLSAFAATTSAELAGVLSDETGSGGGFVRATSPTLTTPDIGVATATSVNGTTIPSSKTLVVTTDTLAVHAATTSAQLAGVISDETGTGALTFATSPTLVTPNIGVATATSINKVAITAPAASATLTIADGKTAIVNNSLTFSGTDSTTQTFQATDTIVGRATTDTLTNKTLTTPTIGSFTNATHNHTNAAGGGQLSLTAAVTGTLPIANGGTAATTAAGALDSLISAEVDVASATTTDLGAAASQNIRITGTVTITGFGTITSGVIRRCRFSGALTLTHNATSLILPGAANITTVAGDSFEAISLGSGNWKVYGYWRTTVTGSGSEVLATSPTLSSPILTTPTVTWTTSAKTANYTAVATDSVIRCDASGGAFTITLPASASNTGMLITIIKTDSSTNVVTVAGNVSELIIDYGSGANTTGIFGQNVPLGLFCNGTAWNRLGPSPSSANLKHKTADQSVTSSTTLVDITDLIFPVEANRSYYFRGFATLVQAGSTANLKLQLNGPASPNEVHWLASPQGITTQAATSYTTLTYTVTTGTYYLAFEGYVDNGANAGNLSLQFSQNTSSGNATTIKKGSKFFLKQAD